MSAGKILCFGEFLLRFSPAGAGQWLRSNDLPVYMGGAELNVATALARWKLPVSYCTALPANELSDDILMALKEKHIETEAVFFSGQRIGSYYLPQGSDLKNHSVIYDRAHSAFSELKPGMLDWESILKGVTWFHFSAISPALNDSVAAVCLEGLKAASRRNITISVDLNHRPKLWQQRQPHNVMAALLPFCDIVMGNIWSAHELLGIPLHHALIEENSQRAYLEHARQTAIQMKKRFGRVKLVASTFRFEKENREIEYFASIYTDEPGTESVVYSGGPVADKVGTGDCFMAGLIYGMFIRMSEPEIIQFATAAAFGKFFEKGDATSQNLETIQARINQYE